MSHVAVAVFARSPQPGQAKTRLIPAVGAAGAAELHACMVAETLTQVQQADVGPVSLWAADEDVDGALHKLARVRNVPLQFQQAGDLGARMRAALTDLTAEGTPAIIVGTDCPGLVPDVLRSAARALVTHDAVVIPALDGGYVLIGMHEARAEPFEDMAWGTDQVLDATRSRFQSIGWNWHEGEPLADIDRPEDLATLVRFGPSWAKRVAALVRENGSQKRSSD